MKTNIARTELQDLGLQLSILKHKLSGSTFAVPS